MLLKVCGYNIESFIITLTQATKKRVAALRATALFLVLRNGSESEPFLKANFKLQPIEASNSKEKSLKVPPRGTFKLFSGFHVSAKRCIPN